MRAKKPIRPTWTTTVDPSEYDYIAHFTRTVKWSNSYNVQCPPTDVGRLWGLVASHQRLERENAALRVQLEDMTNQFFAVSQENAALQQDKERLDWLATSSMWLDVPGTESFTPETLRAAIDAARAEEGGAT